MKYVARIVRISEVAAKFVDHVVCLTLSQARILDHLNVKVGDTVIVSRRVIPRAFVMSNDAAGNYQTKLGVTYVCTYWLNEFFGSLNRPRKLYIKREQRKK